MRRLLLSIPILLAAAACTRDEHAGYDAARDDAAPPPARAAPVAPPLPLTPEDSAALATRLARDSARVAAAFARAEPLTAREVGNLRRDRNARQIATARRLGRRVAGDAEIQQLVREGVLVALGDSTSWWILRDMDHSVPYVTPDTRALLVELGRRFHARMDSLGLPRYRMKVTSALRTDSTQAALRRINSYASRTVSAHEFGTTVDVSHERFAAPAEERTRSGWAMEAVMLDSVGKEHHRVLQAELGRALAELRAAGMLYVMMENRQPVYHFTLARRLGGGAGERRARR